MAESSTLKPATDLWSTGVWSLMLDAGSCEASSPQFAVSIIGAVGKALFI